jgi:hypothetical protein
LVMDNESPSFAIVRGFLRREFGINCREIRN